MKNNFRERGCKKSHEKEKRFHIGGIAGRDVYSCDIVAIVDDLAGFCSENL